MSAIDPASHLRPDWWTDDVFLHLCALEDRALPCRGLSEEERGHPTLPVLSRLLSAVWWLGKTGPVDDERVTEALRTVEANAVEAARAVRLALRQFVGHHDDDQLAEEERACEAADPNYGPPEAHLTQVSFTVRLPGFSGDTVSATIHVDDKGHLAVRGSGPLADLDVLGRLDTRAVIDAIENLVTRQLDRPIATEDSGVSPG
ncbi:hypothetical protein [Streptomyces sp. NPDC056663]|uniref:hypothetical protein n=1 Tax=Streptomyces sp. NPDC056663 TaxID=3345899 RepID=UPI0036A8717E